MSSNWVTRKLKDLITIKHGFAFKGEFFVDEETYDYLITPGNFAIGGGFKGNKFKYYNGPVPEDYILDVGDLVVTMTDLSKQADTLGYSALIPKLEEHRILHNQRVGLIENISDEIDREFLYFLLRSKEYRHHVVSGATGTTVKHTSPTKILSYEFQLPPLDIQRQIAKKLITLEKKVIVNSKTNKILEAMAQAIFKSWFVDFEPVKAKMNEELPDGMNALTASLFPKKLVESELGLIPEGWEVGTLDSHTSMIIDHRGKTPKKLGSDWVEKGYPAISAKNVKSKRIVRPDTIRFIDEITYKKWMKEPLIKGDVIMTSEAPMGELYLFDGSQDFCLSQRLYGLRANCDVCNPVFLFYWLQTAQAKADMKGRSSGSTVLGIKQTELRKVKILVPSKSILDKYSSIASSLIDLIAKNETQNITLEALCDTLLPKLFSGEIELKG